MVDYEQRQNSDVHVFSFDKFEMNDTLAKIENKEVLNTEYYGNKKAFDLRESKNKRQGAENSNYLKSAFWNPKNHMVLTTKSSEPRTNIYTNTRTFAQKHGKDKPKFKVRQTTKQAGDMP